MDTRNIIKNAAFELMETQSFQEISVEDILQLAHVSRRTFYHYYRDKYDLMHEYFEHKIGSILIEKFDGSNWFELTKQSFDYFLSRAPYLCNVRIVEGQDSLWDFLVRYVKQFYMDVKTRNKGEALSQEEVFVAEGIAVVSVHYYQQCFHKPEETDTALLTSALEEMIPLSYRSYLQSEK